MIEITKEQASWRARLDAIGAKQSDLARAIGIHKSLLCGYIKGIHEPGASRFQKIEAEIRRMEAEPSRSRTQSRRRPSPV